MMNRSIWCLAQLLYRQYDCRVRTSHTRVRATGTQGCHLLDPRELLSLEGLGHPSLEQSYCMGSVIMSAISTQLSLLPREVEPGLWGSI